MYKITWDKETGGVMLHSRFVEGTLGTSPRPVFWEELDLLKLNKKLTDLLQSSIQPSNETSK